MRRISPAVARYCDLASFLLKPLKVVTKKTTKRMLIVAFFLGKDRYLAAEQPDKRRKRLFQVASDDGSKQTLSISTIVTRSRDLS